MEEKLTLKVDKYPDWESLMGHVRTKHEQRRQVIIADSLHKDKGTLAARHRVNALGDEIGTGQVSAQIPTPSASSAVKSPTMEEVQAMVNAVANRRPTRGDKGDKAKKPRERFMWPSGTCWECESTEHMQPACPIYARLLAANGGKKPAGHMGAKDKALKAWKEANKKKRAHMKALGYDTGNDTEDDDDDEGDSDLCLALGVELPPMAPVSTSNPFQPLSDGDDSDYDPNFGDDAQVPDFCMKTLDNVARTLSASRSTLPKSPPRRSSAVRANTVSDLDRPEFREVMNALPTSRKSLARLAKLCPSKEVALGPNERWVMADSGSTLHGMNISKELPGYESLVVPLPEHKKGAGAETASGDKVAINGTASLAGLIDGELHTVAFNDMPISMPIASMRQAVKKGNDLHITAEGGVIRNRRTGKTIQLHERGGVYFFKMAFLPLKDQPCPKRSAPKPRASGFARPA